MQFNLLNVKEAAAKLGIKQQTIYNWICTQKDMPAYCKIGRRIMFKTEDIESYIDAHRIDPEAR